MTEGLLQKQTYWSDKLGEMCFYETANAHKNGLAFRRGQQEAAVTDLFSEMEIR